MPSPEEAAGVLIIGVNHHHDVSAGGESETITGLLVASVTAILRMHLHLHVFQRPRDRYRLIVTRVVDHNDKIDNPCAITSS